MKKILDACDIQARVKHKEALGDHLVELGVMQPVVGMVVQGPGAAAGAGSVVCAAAAACHQLPSKPSNGDENQDEEQGGREEDQAADQAEDTDKEGNEEALVSRVL